MRKYLPTLLLAFLTAATASAQEAPPPRRMPRTPVKSATLEDREVIPPSRQLSGHATIIDGERLRIGKTDMRLFGIVPPQLSASFGPQARSVLDSLANGQILTCKIRDRDHDKRLLATCINGNNVDVAHELLKRGLAVAARGSIIGTELASSYIAAEQSAQGQRIGLWSLSAQTSAAAPEAHAKPEPEAATKKEEKAPARTEEQKKEEKAAAQAEAAMQARIADDLLSSQQAAMQIEDFGEPDNEAGMFERYQILISGFLMLLTGLSIAGALNRQKNQDRREEIRALAAALRGELTAARNICAGRAKSITNDLEDRAASWPRIRASLYQAYVGRLGLLGAELARIVASLYGQFSDYASLYNNASAHEASKRQSLESLIKHIDDVLPKLAEIERSGKISLVSYVALRPGAGTGTPVSHIRPVNPETGIPPAHMSSEAAHRSALEIMSGFWESTRGFIGTLKSQEASPRPVEIPFDPHAAEYTAIIEADMEQYQDAPSAEAPADFPAMKKKG